MTTETTPGSTSTPPASGTAASAPATTGTPATPTAGAGTGFLDTVAEATAGGAKSEATAAPAKDGVPAEAKVEATGDKPTGEAPAKDFEIKLPEGFQADEATLSAFKDIAKENGLKPEAAQKIIDLQAKFETARIAQVNTQWEAQKATWVKAVETDKEIGGANLEQSKVFAKKAVDAAGGEELRVALRELGITDHPVLVKAFVKLGKAFAEDTIAGTAGASPTPGNNQEALLSSLYPSMFPSKA
jgi:hypothetical protein